MDANQERQPETGDRAVTRDPESGEQRYPEHDGGTERTARPPGEAATGEEQASGSGS